MSFNLTSLNECFESGSPFCKINLENDNNESSNKNNNENSQNNNNFKDRLDEIYRSFIEYFGDLMMSKHKNMGDYCAYVAKIQCSLAYGCRIVVVVIPNDGMNMGAMRPLHTLYWLNLQTRYSKQEINIQSVSMPEIRNKLMTTTVHRKRREDLKTEYEVEDYPELKVTLFRKKESIQDWSEKNKLCVALNTFCCSVDLI